MSVGAKVTLVEDARVEFGLRATLQALGLSRSTWYYQTQRQTYGEKYEHLRGALESIAREHPEYGYRRTTTELQETYGEAVNEKVVRRLHLLWDLPLMRSTRRPRPSGIRQVLVAAGSRANLVASLETVAPFAVAYTDFTELVYAAGKAELMPIVDHVTKLVLGWELGEQGDTAVALRAWEKAKTTLRRLGCSPEGMIVHHDQDTVYTSYGWTGQLLLRDGVRLSYALEGARDNPEMKSFNSRFKNENRSLLLEAETFEVLRRVVRERLRYYNERRRHSALGNQAPLTYVRALRDSQRRGPSQKPGVRPVQELGRTPPRLTIPSCDGVCRYSSIHGREEAADDEAPIERCESIDVWVAVRPLAVWPEIVKPKA